MTDLAKLIAKADAVPVIGDVEYSTTGLIGLDWALGGGLARGRLVEFHGLESSGKSTIGLQAALAEADRVGRPALWMDYEYAWDEGYVRGLMNHSGAIPIALAQPASIEKGFELAISALSGDAVSSVWFDSTGVMVSDQAGVASMTNARAMAQGIPALIRAVASAGVVCGFVSQTREMIQTGFGSGWSQGPRRKATGGAAIKFAFSQRVEFTHKGKLKGKALGVTGSSEDGIIGRRVIAKVVKNKVGVPWRQVEFDLVDGVGFDPVRHLIELAEEVSVLKRSGAFYEVPGLPKKVQGLQTLSEVLRDPRALPVVVALEASVQEALSESVGIGEVPLDDQEVDDDGSVDEG